MKRVQEYIGNETFCMTYGDGLSDVNIEESIKFHKEQKALATLVAVQQPGRFGAFTLAEGQTQIEHFAEKPKGGDSPWINGGFFVLEPEVMNYIKDDSTIWERDPLENLAKEGKLAAFKHSGFWQPMDTLRDKNVLEDMWQSGTAPWYDIMFRKSAENK